MERETWYMRQPGSSASTRGFICASCSSTVSTFSDSTWYLATSTIMWTSLEEALRAVGRGQRPELAGRGSRGQPHGWLAAETTSKPFGQRRQSRMPSSGRRASGYLGHEELHTRAGRSVHEPEKQV